MTERDVDFVLERFDRSSREMQRGIVLELLRQLKETQDLADSLADRVAKQSELLRKRAEK